MKKILLGLGMLPLVILPVSAMVSCSSTVESKLDERESLKLNKMQQNKLLKKMF